MRAYQDQIGDIVRALTLARPECDYSVEVGDQALLIGKISVGIQFSPNAFVPFDAFGVSEAERQRHPQRLQIEAPLRRPGSMSI